MLKRYHRLQMNTHLNPALLMLQQLESARAIYSGAAYGRSFSSQNGGVSTHHDDEGGAGGILEDLHASPSHLNITGTDYSGQINIRASFFEKVDHIHKNMKDMDDADFGRGIKLISTVLYKELVGTTAVRKSSKFKDLYEEFSRRLERITDKYDLVNYTYFLVRLADFDLILKIDPHQRNQLVTRSITSTTQNAENMDFHEVLRNFGDLVQLDPAMQLANKIHEMITNKDNEVTLNHLWRIMRYVERSKSPRLYSHLVKTSISKMQTKPWKEESLKNIIFMFNAIVNLEKLVYGRFEILNDLIKEIINQKEALVQVDMIKILQGAIQLRTQQQLMLMTQLQHQIQRNLSESKSDLHNHYFLLRFWSLFVQSPFAERIINEDLLKQSLDYIVAGFQQINSRQKESITERDIRNAIVLLQFCHKNDFLLNGVIKEIAHHLYQDYEKNGFRMRHENQEQFIRVMRKIFRHDPRFLEQLTETSLRFSKTEATNLRLCANGLEIFEALDIVKHEYRRQMLSKIKNIIEKETFKFKDIMYLISLYPNKIRTRAFEQLIEMALDKIFTKDLLTNADYQIKMIESLTKGGVSERIRNMSANFIDSFYDKQHSSKIINMFIDYQCMNMSNLDSHNHIFILRFLKNQQELVRCQKDILIRYLAMVAAETKFPKAQDEINVYYIRDLIGDLLSSHKLGQFRALNDSLIVDYTDILENVPVEKCNSIYQQIADSLNEEGEKFYSFKTKLKLAELVCKYFNLKDNSTLLITFCKNLKDHNFFLGIDNIKKFDYIIQLSYILSNVAHYTTEYDKYALQLLNRQLLTLGENPDENTITHLKKTLVVTLFPQRILDKSDLINIEQLQKQINQSMLRILPQMINDFFQIIPQNFDPYQNKIARKFFFGMEMNYMQRFINTNTEQNPNSNWVVKTQTSNGTMLMLAKYQFDHKLLMDIAKKFMTKNIASKNMFHKMNQVVKEAKFNEKMTSIELINLLYIQSQMGKYAKDIDIAKYLFKKRLPEIMGYVQSQEILVRQILNITASLELHHEKQILDFVHKMMFEEQGANREYQSEENAMVGFQWIDRILEGEHRDDKALRQYYPEYLKSLIGAQLFIYDNYHPMISKLMKTIASPVETESQIDSNFNTLMNIMYLYQMNRDQMPHDLLLLDGLCSQLRQVYTQKLRNQYAFKDYVKALESIYPNGEGTKYEVLKEQDDSIIHAKIIDPEMIIQLRDGPDFFNAFIRNESKYLLKKYNFVSYLNLAEFVKQETFEGKQAYVRSNIEENLKKKQNKEVSQKPLADDEEELVEEK